MPEDRRVALDIAGSHWSNGQGLIPFFASHVDGTSVCMDPRRD